ncbi:phage major capsid protein [Methylopila sp. 73B]|uniref:phage major capsid protein n=1 Tax=Methylopila sp. 73B TaxID=1120792 RepID=UPI000361E050|nr:phage major capsid protein [Methylopila sp. 73B]
MPNLNTLREQRDSHETAGLAIRDNAKSESRDFTAEELTALERASSEVREINKQIKAQEFLAEAERRADAQTIHGDGGPRELRNYSLAKAVQESMSGRLTGLEAEVHQDLARGRESRGVMVPTSVLMEYRAVTTTTPAGGPGGALVATAVAPVRDHPRPALLIESLGATVLRDLVGNLDLPVLAESGSAHWIAEHANTTRSDPKFAKKTLSPKTVSGEYELSRRMILQSSTAIETLLRNDLGLILRQEVDRAALAGTGTANMPRGVLNTVGIHVVPPEADFSDTTAEMIAALELDDLTGSRAFVTNPGVMRLARKTKDADGHVIPLAELFHGERVATTTQVPSTYDTDKNALIYGQWSELVLGYWSGVDILVNPYHADVASKGGVLIHAFLDVDVLVRTPEAFAAAGIA